MIGMIYTHCVGARMLKTSLVGAMIRVNGEYFCMWIWNKFNVTKLHWYNINTKVSKRI